jgi:hypothetical protein
MFGQGERESHLLGLGWWSVMLALLGGLGHPEWVWCGNEPGYD